MGLLTDELEKGLTASVVELIVMGRGADVLKALGQLERGAILGGGRTPYWNQRHMFAGPMRSQQWRT